MASLGGACACNDEDKILLAVRMAYNSLCEASCADGFRRIFTLSTGDGCINSPIGYDKLIGVYTVCNGKRPEVVDGHKYIIQGGKFKQLCEDVTDMGDRHVYKHPNSRICFVSQDRADDGKKVWVYGVMADGNRATRDVSGDVDACSKSSVSVFACDDDDGYKAKPPPKVCKMVDGREYTIRTQIDFDPDATEWAEIESITKEATCGPVEGYCFESEGRAWRLTDIPANKTTATIHAWRLPDNIGHGCIDALFERSSLTELSMDDNLTIKNDIWFAMLANSIYASGSNMLNVQAAIDIALAEISPKKHGDGKLQISTKFTRQAVNTGLI
ncbi:MAG: hypothetical protein ACRCWR_01800 [Saezia sp.]